MLGATANGDRLPSTMFVGHGALRVFGDGARLNVVETRPVTVVMKRELRNGIDRDAAHAQLASGHPLDLIREIQGG